jgi:hypothetical protein
MKESGENETNVLFSDIKYTYTRSLQNFPKFFQQLVFLFFITYGHWSTTVNGENVLSTERKSYNI